MIYEFAIIGTGPSSFAAIKALRDRGFAGSILILKSVEQDDDKIKYKKYKLKNNLKSENIFSFSTELKLRRNLILASSQSFGGFSKIWGAVFDPSINFEMVKNIDVKDEWQGTKSRLIFNSFIQNQKGSTPPHKFKLNYLTLAVDPEKCNQCGDCINGCPRDAIWNAGQSINEEANLITIEIRPISSIDLQTYQKNHLFEFSDILNRKFLAKKVIVACGLLASSLIYLNTFPGKQEVLIDQSTLRIAIIYRKISVKIIEKLSLAQNGFGFTVSNNSQIYGQIYSNVGALKQYFNARSFLFRLIPFSLWLFLTKNINLVFVYFNPGDCNKIRIFRNLNNNQYKYDTEIIKNTRWRFLQARTFFSLRKHFRGLNFHLLPFWKKTLNGYSFHLAGNPINDIASYDFLLFADGLTFSNNGAENFTSRLMDDVYKQVCDWYETCHGY